MSKRKKENSHRHKVLGVVAGAFAFALLVGNQLGGSNLATNVNGKLLVDSTTMCPSDKPIQCWDNTCATTQLECSSTAGCQEGEVKDSTGQCVQEGSTGTESYDDYEDDSWEDGDEDDYYDDYYDDGQSGTVPADEIERVCKDWSKQLEDLKKNLTKRFEKELGKRVERGIKENTKSIERLEKMIAKAEKKGFSASEIDDLNEELENLKERLAERQDLVVVVQALYDDFKADFEIAKSLTETNCSKSTMTWDENNNTWQTINKLNYYWVLGNVVDVQIGVSETFAQFIDFNREVTRVQYMFTKAGVDAPSELTELINQTEEISEMGTNLIAEANEIGDQVIEIANTCESNYEDCEDIWILSEDLQWLMQDWWDTMDDWHYSEPWNVLDEIRFGAQCYEQVGFMKEELTRTREEIGAAVEFLDGFAKLNITSLNSSLENAYKAADNGLALIDEMEAQMSEACTDTSMDEFDRFEKFEKFWPAMEQLGRAAQKYFGDLTDYLVSHGDAYDELTNYVSEDIINEMIHFGREFEGDYWEEYDVEGDVFSDLESQLSDAVTKMLQQGQIDSALIEEIANLIADKVVEKMTAAIMNHFDALGSELGNQLMENNNLVAQYSIDVKNLSNVDKSLIEEAQTTVYINSDTATEVAGLLEEIGTTAESGGNVDPLEEDLKKYIKKAQEEATGTNGVEFKDVKITDESWYTNYVIGGKQEGIVKGYGDGEFKPGNNVTVAEVIKIAAESCGKGAASGTPADSKAQGHWASGYVKTFENEGIGSKVKFDNLDSFASRKQAFGILAGMCDIQPVSWAGAFSDLAGTDPLAGEMQALFDLGVVTGEGGTGKLNPDGLINRAAVMKIMAESDEAIEEGNFDTQILQDNFDAEDFLDSFESNMSGDPGAGYEDPYSSGDPGAGYGNPEDFEEDYEEEDYGFEDYDFEEEFDELEEAVNPF